MRVSSELTPKNTSFVKLQNGSPNANPLPLIAQLALKFPKASPANVLAKRMLLEMKWKISTSLIVACSLHQHLRYHQLVLPASVLPHSKPGAKCSSNVTGPGGKNICIVMWKSQFQHQHRHKHHDRTHSHRSVHAHYISVVLLVVVVNITVFLMFLITCFVLHVHLPCPFHRFCSFSSSSSHAFCYQSVYSPYDQFIHLHFIQCSFCWYSYVFLFVFFIISILPLCYCSSFSTRFEQRCCHCSPKRIHHCWHPQAPMQHNHLIIYF